MEITYVNRKKITLFFGQAAEVIELCDEPEEKRGHKLPL
jgi:hypothetical protein